MLSKEENELITRVGPGTPMGNLMRQYWIPALMSQEVPEPDGPPVRVMLLGEPLIAFRDSTGRVGLIGNSCPHRGASLFFGRNEEAGLRCVYHGWKFDVSGACVDMPSEPPESNFKSKVRATAYPCQERGGLVWTYMGPRDVPPALPELEANMLPDGAWAISPRMNDCNWLQVIEGDLDTCHAAILHEGAVPLEATVRGTFSYYALLNRAPRYKIVDTDYGTMYGAYRPAEDDTLYWRIAHFLFPFYAMAPPGVLGLKTGVIVRVPADDHHTVSYFINAARSSTPSFAVDPADVSDYGMTGGQERVPNTTDWLGRWRFVANRSNDYLLDRDKQRRMESYTGIPGIQTQDQALTENMGPVLDRSAEHLGTSDTMIIRIRQRLLNAVRELQEHGTIPPGVDDPAVYRVRSGGVILPGDADWIEATRHLVQAFVPHPEIDPAVLGPIAGVSL